MAFDDEDITTDRATIAAATSGPWKADVDAFDDEIEACVTDPAIDMLAKIGTDVPLLRVPDGEPWTDAHSRERDARWRAAEESQAMRDAAFIAAARTRWPAALDEVERLRRRVAELAYEAAAGTLPVPMILTCPMCGRRHIDRGEFATRPHHTHSCQVCGMTWRPALGATVGVQFLPGYKNEPNRCAIAGCAAAFDPDGDDGVGWVFRDGYGWHCPPHVSPAVGGEGKDPPGVESPETRSTRDAFGGGRFDKEAP